MEGKETEVEITVNVKMSKAELIDAIAASSKLTKADAGRAKLEVDVNVEMTKAGLIDAIAAGAKLTKADAGRALNAAIESTIKLKGFKAMEPEL